MKQILVWCFCGFVMVANAQQQENVSAYIDRYKDIAMAEMQRSGVPASITLAQGLLESGCGQGELCKTSNNHFGIKCKTEWTGDKVYHDDDEKQECFRSYPSAAESYKDHSNFLKTREPYSFLFLLKPTDYKGWAKGLKKAGYATEKDYPQKLIKIIDDYNLNQYTLLALNNKPSDNNNSLATTTQPAKIAADTDMVKDTVLGELTIPVTAHAAFKKPKPVVEKGEDSVVITNPNFTIDKKSIDSSIKASYPVGVFAINHAKVVYVEEGYSLLSLAKQYDISLSKLLEFNEMEDVDVTNAAQLIFLEKKQTKGNTETHIAKANENLHEISQEEGVRLDKILEYNKLKKESVVNIGDKILLRPVATYGLSK
ncbi:glycoside hydrolase family 73 protein [Parasediminibacterium sp. JCM 36343]|uniref:glycoside hydrolase family 73 protein n=1 Tax=Parasediminibacterium sp. JCM 36343 TaxID=3374279 RepID=UPI00397C2C73